MSNILDDTLDNAKSFTETAREGAQHVAHNARSTFLDGLNAVTGFVTMLRGLEVDDALGWIGLARRRSPLATIAMFGAGVVVGAGIGMVLAPRSGADVRRMIRQRFWGLEQDAKRGLEQAGAAARQYEQKLEQKAENIAGKAKETVKETAQELIGKARDVAKDVEGKVEGAVGASGAGTSQYGSQPQGSQQYEPRSSYGNKTPGQHNRMS